MFNYEVTNVPALTPKTLILEEAGYIYHFDREMYFNRRTKKAFSLEFVEDHQPNEIQKLIATKKTTRNWSFYFNSILSSDIRRQLEQVLG